MEGGMWVFGSRRVWGGGRGGLAGLCVMGVEAGEERTLEADS